MIIDLDETPGTRAIFEALKAGQHISCDNDHQALWSEYTSKADQWKSLFRLLGYELREEHESYCYLVGEGQSRSITGMSIFLLVLVRSLLRQGEDPFHAMMSRTWTSSAYPHNADDRSREIMRMANISTVSDFDKIEQMLVRHGFARRTQTGLAFCQPVRRIIDLCIEVAQQAEHDKNTGADDAQSQEESMEFSV